MKAIIIEEERFAEIRELMELKVLEIGGEASPFLDVSAKVWKAAITEAQRIMNYYFVRWAQEQGASCHTVRRKI
jgi:hypothetical protein